MRPKSIILGHMGGSGYGRRVGKALVTGQLREQSSLEVDIWAVLGRMGWDMPEKLMVLWMATTV